MGRWQMGPRRLSAVKTILLPTTITGSLTKVLAVSCSCPSDQWYSVTMLDGNSELDTFCMPHTSCPPGMTTSLSRNEFCATAMADVCVDVPVETSFCQCADPMQTPVYPEESGAAATGCEY